MKLDHSPQQANLDFCSYMQDIALQPYAVQAVVFWSIEQAYNQVAHLTHTLYIDSLCCHSMSMLTVIGL